MRYASTTYKIFTIFNYIFIGILSIICILPLIHILAVSLSSSAAATANIVNFIPIDFTFDAYERTIGNSNFIRSLLIAVQRTLMGTGFSMMLITLAAYALSKSSQRFPGRNLYVWFFVFTMLFNGGLIPTYLVVNATGINNTIWALVIPPAVNVFNMILMLNFFRNIPNELEEAALMDGAGQFTTLFRIYLPLSTPVIATLSLFAMVFHWNSWFDAMIYIANTKDYPLATFLHSIVVSENLTELTDLDQLKQVSNRTVKASQIFIGALPILLVYPFLQKYFVRGIVLGSVKE